MPVKAVQMQSSLLLPLPLPLPLLFLVLFNDNCLVKLRKSFQELENEIKKRIKKRISSPQASTFSNKMKLKENLTPTLPFNVVLTLKIFQIHYHRQKYNNNNNKIVKAKKNKN
ncbi:hypothetical protein GQX74_007282 [Glossina fuscipes]|nr:hypothetical protein GQX74_007282 [Glossina fuscipes]